ncbi:MAG: molybdopterin cofactor-binding domain-containing protein [Burkholderiales bacterium]
MDTAMNLSRRNFLASSASGLVLGFVLPGLTAPHDADAAGTATPINSWLTIGSDDSITLTIGASEMGQGSFSGLAQILAEDLMVDYARVATVQGGPTLVNPAPVGTAINTVGSSVTRRNYWTLRDAAAVAREMLVQAAMNRKGDPVRANYAVTNGVVAHVPSGTSLTYGAVAADAALLPRPSSAPLVPDSQFKSIGKIVPRVDIPAKIDGSAEYGIDVRIANMVYAVIKHCPTFGGKLAALPGTPSGMIGVVPVNVTAGTGRGTETTALANAVAVVGPNTWDTWQAAKRMSVNWTLPANATTLNDAQFLADATRLSTNATPYVAGGANPPGTLYTVEASAADAKAALTTASKVIQATYTLPYVAHACMEVLNCTVDYQPGVKCDVYAPTQSARSVLALVTTMTGMPESQVKIHTTYLGGGLGRKSEVDFVAQAVQVAMAIKRPVQLFWPREEDFARDQYRPMGLIRATAGLDANGNIVAWTYRNVSPSILAQRGAVLGPKGDSQGYEASQDLPYDFGARLTEYVSHPSPIPVGFWRSVGASLNTFGVESMMDELAAAAKRDPYEYRRSKLTDSRWIAVLDAAAQLGNWYAPLAPGRARGIAIGTAFGSIVAEVVEIASASSTGITVGRVSVAIDPYLHVNPGQVEAQIVGGVVHGLNATLYGRQAFLNGVPQSRNFNRSRMIRAREMPRVDVKILPNPAASDRTVAIGGVGELGVPTFAPALANAYFKLTGIRQRSLPFFPNATMSGL